MKQSIQAAMSKSAEAFQNIVWPSISQHVLVGGGIIKPVEAVASTAFANELDMYSGIDAWQVLSDRRAIRGIASRVQWDSPYRSFTIRYSKISGQKTEYEKRLDAIKNEDEGLLYPHLTIQAYIDSTTNSLVAAASIPTKQLILQAELLLNRGVIKEHGDARFGLRRLSDGTEFIYLSWGYLSYTDLKDKVAYATVESPPKPS
jgi:hypothetical protein